MFSSGATVQEYRRAFSKILCRLEEDLDVIIKSDLSLGASSKTIRQRGAQLLQPPELNRPLNRYNPTRRSQCALPDSM